MKTVGPYRLKIPSEAKQIADKALDDFVEAVDRLHIRYFLAFGTCLGFVRDGENRGYDFDIIIDFTEEDFQRLTETLIARGFKEGQALAVNLQRHFLRDYILFDLWINRPSSERRFLESPEKVGYNGKEYNVPSPVEEYLEFTYGKDWRVPK